MLHFELLTFTPLRYTTVMKLIIPDISFRDSFIAALKEYEALEFDNPTARYFYDENKRAMLGSFADYVLSIRGQADGNYLPKGYVPQTVYWLVDGDEFIGTTSIRHELTEYLLRIGGHIGYNIRPSKRNMGYGTQILKLALEKAKELHLTKVLVTCDETNIASKKIIETNGGIFENSEPQRNGLPNKLRYWIDLK